MSHTEPIQFACNRAALEAYRPKAGICPDLDAAIERIDASRGPQTCRVISEKCQECDRVLTSTETIHVTDGVVKCDPCWRGKVVDYSTYPPMHRSNWDE